MSELRFDADTHTYYLGNEKLPSVTQILKPLYDFSAVPTDVLRRAAAFGTAVHKTIELYLLGELDIDALDGELLGPLMAFKKWEGEHGELSYGSPYIETPGYHKRLKYAGTPDLDYEHAIIDIKSRPVNLLTDPLQLAAYDNLGSGRRDRFVLELKQDSNYVFTHIDRTAAAKKRSWSRFRYLLDFHNMKSEIERWK